MPHMSDDNGSDRSMLAEARRLTEIITRRMGDQLLPDDLALIRSVREAMPETD